MQIHSDVSLAKHSTMRLGGQAQFVAEITSEDDLLKALEFAQEKALPYRLIGEGSNIIWSGDFAGLVIVNKIEGIEINGLEVIVGAGENWDAVVAATVDENLSGLELLSLIPGTAGATPVQNVGAYGGEIKDVLTRVRAYDTQTEKFVELTNEDCGFGYRSSRFNGTDKGRFLITQIQLQLRHEPLTPPFYPALQSYLAEHNLTDYSPGVIRQAVMAIRSMKLPDPSQVANCGSFFKNPILSAAQYQSLKQQYPDIPGFESGDGVKVPAAWLLEQAGFKDYFDPNTGLATYPQHALVVINKSAQSPADLLAFKNKLTAAVAEKFGVELEQEPEMI